MTGSPCPLAAVGATTALCALRSGDPGRSACFATVIPRAPPPAPRRRCLKPAVGRRTLHRAPGRHEVVGLDSSSSRSDLPTATSLLDWRRSPATRTRAGSSRARLRGRVRRHGESHPVSRAGLTRARPMNVTSGSADRCVLHQPDVKNGKGPARSRTSLTTGRRGARWRVKDRAISCGIGILVPLELSEIETLPEPALPGANLLPLAANRRAIAELRPQRAEIAEQLGYGSGCAAVEHFMTTLPARVARISPRPVDYPLSRAISRRRGGPARGTAHRMA